VHEISIGPCQRFAYFLGTFGFAHAIVATCDDDDGLATFFATKHDGLGDLRNRAPDCNGCLGAGARWLVKLDGAGCRYRRRAEVAKCAGQWDVEPVS